MMALSTSLLVIIVGLKMDHQSPVLNLMSLCNALGRNSPLNISEHVEHPNRHRLRQGHRRCMEFV